MAIQRPPSEYEYADATKLFFRSRRTLGVIFLFFLVGGAWLASRSATLWISIGTSLLASSLISLVTLVVEFLKGREDLRAQKLQDAGLLAVFSRRDLEEYDALVRKATRIDVTGYTLKSFLEQNEETITRRAADRKPMDIRMILVDPDTEAAKIMERAEGLSAQQYAGNQNALITRLSSVPGVQIRLLSRHLSMMIYRIDDVLYTGPYPITGRSRTAFTLKLTAGWLFESQEREFDALWEEARPPGVPVTTES